MERTLPAAADSARRGSTDYEFAVPRTMPAPYLIVRHEDSIIIGGEINWVKLLDLLGLAEPN